MKVIDQHDPPEPWCLHVSCTGAGNDGPGCGSLLLVEADDLFRTERDYYDGTTDWFVTIRCPVCGTLTDLQKSSVPTGLLASLPLYSSWKRRQRRLT